jgi:hypothetical protein
MLVVQGDLHLKTLVAQHFGAVKGEFSHTAKHQNAVAIRPRNCI